ncbi:MAG TPA: tetratricopeptide repeat protein [Gemmatimonadales bacterium]|nr:tetratricopeptide repeat protein [Gemmatimonadales bacterium]
MYRFVVVVIVLGLGMGAGTARAQFRLPMKLEELERRMHADSNDPAAHFNVALAYWNAKRWQDTDKALRTAIMLDPRFAPAYVALAYLPFAQRSSLWDEVRENRVPDEWKARMEESDQFFRHAYMIDPFVELRSGDVVQERSSAYLDELEMFFGEYVRDYFDGIDQYFQAKYQDSYDRLTRVINYLDGDRHPDRVPNNVFWWHGLASARVEKWPDAIADFDRLVDRSLAPTKRDSLVHFPLRTNEFRYILAYVKQRSGAVNEAIDLYREALTNDIGLYMAHVRLADMYETAQMFPQAIKSRQNAVNANPDDESLLLDLGKTLAVAGQPQEAVKTLRQAASVNPRDPRPSFYLGIVLEQMGQKDDARAAFSQFTSLAPSRYDRQISIAKQHLAALQ